MSSMLTLSGLARYYVSDKHMPLWFGGETNVKDLASLRRGQFEADEAATTTDSTADAKRTTQSIPCLGHT